MKNKIFSLVFITVLVLLVGTDYVKGDDVNDNDNVLRIDGSSIDGESEGTRSWDEDMWYVQVDGVMGGKSSGDMEFIEMNFDDESDSDSYSEMLKFTGDISLDGGGFSSVRRRISLDLSNYDGIIVTLEADTYTYNTEESSSSSPTGIHLQFGDSSSYYDFSSAFAIPLASSSSSTSTSTLTSVYLPMDSFNRGTRMGFSCRNNDCELDNTRINNLSIYVLFQEGSFDVRIKSISAVPKKEGGGGPRSFLSPQIQFESTEEIIDLLQSTINSGASLYDMSYIELCIVMYWSVLNSILNASSSESIEEEVVVPTSMKVVICAGLNEMIMLSKEENDNSSKRDQAFALRYTIDAIMADLQGFDRSTNGDQYLPTMAEAESMDVITCVGRTSPTEGTLYDSYGNIVVVDDNDIDIYKGNSSSSSSTDLEEEDDEETSDENNDAQTMTDNVAVQKTASVSDSISTTSSSATASTSASTSTYTPSSSSSWTVLIILAVVGLIDCQLVCML